MATQTNLQLLLSKGPLGSLWENKTLKTDVAINNGQLYVGLGTDGRAMLFIDEDNRRYPFTASVKWDDIQDLPDLVYDDEFNTLNTNLNTQISNKVSKSGDTMTGPLAIAHDDTESGLIKKVTLDYNERTESLDFSFT